MKRIFPSAPSTFFAIALLVLAGLALKSYPAAAEGARALPMPAVDQPPGQATSAVVVLAGGCFWGVQGVSSTRG
jgi:peptide-methionine (S)-S-oxide reductase